MDKYDVKELLKFIWKNNLKQDFINGKLIYERQLQALLYHYLRSNLDKNYNVWVEPVVYFLYKDQKNYPFSLEKSKPDLIITYDTKINSKLIGKVIAILELKYAPWSYIRE